MEGLRRGMLAPGRRVSWNALRWVMGVPLLITAICTGGLLNSPAFADEVRTVQTTKVALDMYNTDFQSGATSGGTTSSQSTAFADSATNSYSATVSSTDLPPQVISTATADASGFHFVGTTSQSGTSASDAQTGFTIDFGVEGPLGYTFSGTFGSSSSTATEGSFLVSLVDLDTGETLFSHSDTSLPPEFSTSLSDANSTGGLSGTFLPGVNYELSVSSDSSPPDDSSGDPSITTSADVFVAFEVPEPASGGMLLAGVGVMLMRRRTRKVSAVGISVRRTLSPARS